MTRWRVIGVEGIDDPNVVIAGDISVDVDDPELLEQIEQSARRHGLLLERIDEDAE